MLKHYFNQINPNVRILPALDEDFHIYKIIKRDAGKALDLTAALNDYKDQIVSIRYSGAIIYVMVKSDSALNDDIIKDLLSSDDILGVDLATRNTIDTQTVLNLLLYMYSTEKFGCAGHDINGKFVQVVQSSNNDCISIVCQFNADNNDIRLDANVNTFSKFHLLTEKAQKKCKGFYLLTNGTMIKKPVNMPNDETIFALKQRFEGKKNSWDSFKLKSPSGNSKIDIIGDIYTYFKSSKYVANFDFECVDLEAYDDHKYFDVTKKYYEEFFSKNALNVVCPNDFDTSIFNQDCFSFIKTINFVDTPSNGLNLVLMKFTEKSENTEADELYINNYKSDYICQHININEFVDKSENKKKNNKAKTKLASAIITALRELIIKHELSTKKIESFDWTKCQDCSVSKLTFCKKLINNDGDELFYSIVIDMHTGELSTFVCDDPEFLGDAIYHMDENDIGTIVAEDGRAIILQKTPHYIVPSYREYIDEISKILSGKSLAVDGDELYDELIAITKERPEWRESIQRILSDSSISPYVFENSEETIGILDVKGVIQKCGENPRAMSDRVDKWVRNEYDAAIVSHIKEEKTRNIVFPGLVGLHYNDDLFTVAESAHTISDQARNIGIKQIKYYNNATPDLFKSILPLFYVPFVRNNMLSAKPFLFKYLDEWIKQETFEMERKKDE